MCAEEAVVSGWGYRLQRTEKDPVKFLNGWSKILKLAPVDILSREFCAKLYAGKEKMIAAASRDESIWFDLNSLTQLNPDLMHCQGQELRFPLYLLCRENS